MSSACLNVFSPKLLLKVLESALADDISYTDDTAFAKIPEEDIRLFVCVVFEQLFRLGLCLNPL